MADDDPIESVEKFADAAQFADAVEVEMARMKRTDDTVNRQNQKPHPLDPDINPWERQPRETLPAYRAFETYRDSHHRKVGRIAREHGSTVPAWSVRHSWSYRALAWDRFLAQQDADDAVRFRRVMNNRQRRAAALAQAKVIQWLQGLDPATLSAHEAVRWFEVAVKVERLASGEATSKIGVASESMVSQMSAEDVAVALARIQEEIAEVTGQAEGADGESADAR